MRLEVIEYKWIDFIFYNETFTWCFRYDNRLDKMQAWIEDEYSDDEIYWILESRSFIENTDFNKLIDYYITFYNENFRLFEWKK